MYFKTCIGCTKLRSFVYPNILNGQISFEYSDPVVTLWNLSHFCHMQCLSYQTQNYKQGTIWSIPDFEDSFNLNSFSFERNVVMVCIEPKYSRSFTPYNLAVSRYWKILPWTLMGWRVHFSLQITVIFWFVCGSKINEVNKVLSR